MKRICVIGLGYVGLPTASMFATHGFEVLGVDKNPEVISKLKRGDVHIFEPGLKVLVEAALKSKNFVASMKVKKSDVFVICVPTPLREKRADLSHLKEAATSISHHLKKDNLVILESTVPPKTTREVLAPILENSGLKTGKDFYLAYCPERVLPGKILREIVSNDRIIGGYDTLSAKKAEKLYSTFVEGELYLTDSTTAEVVKLSENTFRDVNIAFANELALICEEIGVNAFEIIEFANRHPRVYIHKPGCGVGGHCIPIDPFFLVEKRGFSKLISISREINTKMPLHLVELAKAGLRRFGISLGNASILILGVSYKENTDDARESPTKYMAEELKRRGASLKIFDPYVREFEFEIEKSLNFKNLDCLILSTAHEVFRDIDLFELKRGM
ncbi:MAG: nucleotide sugar dehydrogenase, partial [Candidatus Methanofastidiosia archaeon]